MHQILLLFFCKVFIFGEGTQFVDADVLGITLIIMLGKLSDCSTGLNDIALNMSPYYKFNFYISVALVLIMVIGLALAIPVYGIYGAAWVSAIVMILFNLAKTYFVWKKMDFQPFSKGTLITVIIGAATAALVMLLPKWSNPYIDTLIRSCAIVVAFASLTFWLKPSKDVSHYINETLKKKKLF
jgi:O-antigen/teichoic acid export membrane protein